MSAGPSSPPPAADQHADTTTVPGGRGFRPAGDASLLLAASDGHPAILIVVDVERDAVSIRSAGLDPSTIPGFLQRLGVISGLNG